MIKLFPRTLPLLIGIACVTGCGDKRSTPERPRDSSGSHAKGAAERAGSSTVAGEPTMGIFKVLTFERASLPKEYIYQGAILGGAHWVDTNGDNTLIVSQRETSLEHDFRRQEIFGYDYVTKDGTTRLLWKIQDAADNYCDRGEGLISDITVLDLDGDEVGENAFIYNVQGRCDVSPRPYKLMLHSGEKKYALRGTNRVNPGDGMVGGEKNFDPAFDGAPKEFKEYASEMWQKYVR